MALKSYTRLKDFIQNNALGNAPWDQGRFNAVDLMDSTLMLEDLTRQQTLKGTYVIEGSGIVGASETALITITPAGGISSNKGTISIPAHATITNFGMVFQTALTGATGCVVNAAFGSADGLGELAGGIMTDSGNSDATGRVADACLSTKVDSTGNILLPVDAAELYSATARTVQFDAPVSGAAIGGSSCIVFGYVNYHVNYELLIA